MPDLCPICLDELNETLEHPVHKMKACGHKVHYKCLYNNMFHGNLTCPTCRKLPEVLELNVTLLNEKREEAVEEHNRVTMQTAFRRGLIAAKKPGASKKLKVAFKSYQQEKRKLAKEAQEQRYCRQTAAAAVKEMQEKVDKVLHKYMTSARKTGHKAKRISSLVSYNISLKDYRFHPDPTHNAYKRQIALAMGWSRVPSHDCRDVSFAVDSDSDYSSD